MVAQHPSASLRFPVFLCLPLSGRSTPHSSRHRRPYRRSCGNRVAGLFSVNINAFDTVGVLAFSSLPLTVLPGPLNFPGGAYPNGKVGVPYYDITPYLNTSGGTPPFSISLVGGTLPPGLTFSDGLLSGTPTAAGTYTLQLQATDSSTIPQTLTATYTITINP